MALSGVDRYELLTMGKGISGHRSIETGESRCYSPISNKRTGTLIFFPILVVRYSYYNPVRLFFLPLFGSPVLLL